jgi:hypothetical protein
MSRPYKVIGVDYIFVTAPSLVMGVVTESMGGFPASLALPGALVGQQVKAIGTQAGNLVDVSANFEVTISIAGQVQQLNLSTPSTGVVMIVAYGYGNGQ